jgi:hypothetical protein
MLLLRSLAATPVVHSGRAAVERARQQWWQRKAKRSLSEEGKRNGVRLRERGVWSLS